MSDLVERLRALPYADGNRVLDVLDDVVREAADEIERLRVRINLADQEIDQSEEEIQRLREEVALWKDRYEASEQACASLDAVAGRSTQFRGWELSPVNRHLGYRNGACWRRPIRFRTAIRWAWRWGMGFNLP